MNGTRSVLTNTNKDQDKLAIVAELDKSLQYLGSIRKPKNHRWYKMNLNNMTISELKDEIITLQVMDTKGKVVQKQTLNAETGHIYDHALNLINIKKKFYKKLQAHAARQGRKV